MSATGRRETGSDSGGAKPETWAELDRLAEAATVEMLKRPDREEAEAGLEPWRKMVGDGDEKH